MIRPIKITLNAAHPEVPLIEATTFVGSPSAVFVSGVPATVGLWRITAVKVVAHYPDDSATTVECVKGASGVWTATLPATATSGRVTHGFEVLADGLDERGDAVTGYVLGYADFAVFTRDMTIDSGGTVYYMHYFDAVPETPKKGDVAPDGSGGLQLYDGTAWVPMGGYTPPAGGIPKTDLSSGVQASLDKADTALQTAPVTSVNSKTGAVTLTASDVGALGNSGDQTLNGTLSLVPNGSIISALSVIIPGQDGIGISEGFQITPPTFTRIVNNGVFIIGVPAKSGTLALLSDIAVKAVKLNGTALTPDANGAVDIVLTTDDLDYSSGGGSMQLTLALDTIFSTIGDLAPLASPAFTGTPTAPTPTAGDNSTKVATTAFVKNAIDGISVTPLSGNTYDFSTMQGVFDALKAAIEALGGTVTNAPTSSQGE